MNPSYRWELAGWYRDVYTTGHSQSSSQTSVWKRELTPHSKQGLIWYVDRSKTSKGIVVGLCRWGLKRGHSFSSGFFTTVCQAELYVINECIVDNIEKGYTGRDRYIQESSSH